MTFLISDTFTSSLARLTGDEQKSAKTTAFDLQVNPANPGHSFHKLDGAKDKNFWSVRVSRDIRIIVHKTQGSLLLCYVDHHDKAYDWAERRRLEAHPTTGAAQIVEIRETVQEIFVPVYVQDELPVQRPASQPTLAHLTAEQLSSFGVPEDWIPDVLKAGENELLAIAERLPGEAAEALLELAVGGKPKAPQKVSLDADPFSHPDAQRRFRVMENVEELERALDFPWDKWSVFLHPEQRQSVERNYNGPARVSGTAGTGKTIVALHRAAFLARTHPDARILLTTFSPVLANALRHNLRRLIGNEPRLGERIDVRDLDSVALRLYKVRFGEPKVPSAEDVRNILISAASKVDGHKFTTSFLFGEWLQVIDAWQLNSWEDYSNVARLGRKTRLPEAQRQIIWQIMEKVNASLSAEGWLTLDGIFAKLTAAISAESKPPFDYVIVDEAQDVSIAQLRFLSSFTKHRPDALFFTGDLGQRIFQQAFSWASLGIDIRGRSRNLRINYRTSHQIRCQADRLLDPEVSDVDGNSEKRDGTISLFNGPPPELRLFDEESEEIHHVTAWLRQHAEAGIPPHEIAIIVRSEAQLPRAEKAATQADFTLKILDEAVGIQSGSISLLTMHLAKGLEFKAVAVMACDDEILPLQERIEAVTDEADLEEVYNTERHLFYVACTRARDLLLITGLNPPSEFLEDLRI